jgi:hypothetical protein
MEDDEKAVRLILAEHDRRKRGEAEPMDETLIALLEDEYPEALLIGRKRNGRYVVLIPQPEEPEGPFTTEVEYVSSGREAARTEWTLIQHRADRWRVAVEGEGWKEWDRDAYPTDYISLPERRAIVGGVRFAWGERLLGARYVKERGRFRFWLTGKGVQLPPEDRKITGSVEEPEVLFFEMEWKRDRGRVTLPSSYYESGPSSLLYPYTRRHEYVAGKGSVFSWERMDWPSGASRGDNRKPGLPPWITSEKPYYGIGATEHDKWKVDQAFAAKQENARREMLYENPELLARLAREDAVAKEAEAEAKRLRARAQAYELEVQEVWKDERLEAIRAAFWEKHGAEAAQHLWPTYRRNHVKDPEWKYDSSTPSYWRDTYHAEEDLGGALERVIEDGFDPAGLTVGQLADLAAYCSLREYDEYEEKRKRRRRRGTEEWAWEVPEDVASIVIPELAEEPPLEEEDEGDWNADDEELDDDQAEAEEYEEVDGEAADEEDDDGAEG